MRFRPAADPAAPGTAKRPDDGGGGVEPQRARQGAGRDAGHPPARRLAQPGRAADSALAGPASTSSIWSTTSWTRWRASSRARTRTCVGPMAIKLVRLSSNLRPEFARTLETRLIARLTNSTNVKIAICPECTSVRSRVEDGQLGPDAGGGERGRPAPHRRQDGRQDVHGGRLHVQPDLERRVDVGRRLSRVRRRRSSGATPTGPTRRWRCCCAPASASRRAPSAWTSWNEKISTAPVLRVRAGVRHRADWLRGPNGRHRRREGDISAVSREVRREPDQPVRPDR